MQEKEAEQKRKKNVKIIRQHTMEGHSLDWVIVRTSHMRTDAA